MMKGKHGTGIEWTQVGAGFKGETWNPVVGCSKVSAGCRNCYAERMAKRLNIMGPDHYQNVINEDGCWSGRIGMAGLDTWMKPLHWRKSRCIFVNSMSDVFHPGVSDEIRDRLWAVMALTPQHRYLILTKRPAEMERYVDRLVAGQGKLGDGLTWLGADGYGARLLIMKAYGLNLADKAPEAGEPPYAPFPNVGLGVSVEDQAAADERLPLLLETQAAMWFVYCEQLLGAVSLDGYLPGEWSCVRCGYVGNATGNEYCVNCEEEFPPPGEHGELILCPCGCDEYENACPRCGETDPFGAFGCEGKSPTPQTLDWVIAGGESGPGARPIHPDWARGLRDQCESAKVPFFFKQWGEWAPIDSPASVEACPVPLGKNEAWLDMAGGQDFHGDDVWRMHRLGKKAAGRVLDGRTWDGYPGWFWGEGNFTSENAK